MIIPQSHPRYASLVKREKIVAGIEAGITSKQGLIAHGRGEAFDYLIGERTLPSARHATEVAAALLLTAKKPVLSVNGNVAALVSDQMIALSNLVNAPLEVNIFYWTEERVRRIKAHLERHGASTVLGDVADARIPGLESARARVSSDGIYAADVVLAPLEDGDRCEALLKLGKQVISIDLNPLSRTSQQATVSIVDDIERALSNLLAAVQTQRTQSEGALAARIAAFDNRRNLREVVEEIASRLRGADVLEF
jgi:4-phosphopantoate--beta-alanine ligase